MLEIRIQGDVYGLDDESAAELVRRLEPTTPLEDGEPVPGSVEEKLRDAVHSQEPADLDTGHFAILGSVIEAWALELDGDVPADVQELRHAIAARLR